MKKSFRLKKLQNTYILNIIKWYDYILKLRFLSISFKLTQKPSSSPEIEYKNHCLFKFQENKIYLLG